jgi:acetyl esterase/lipase
MLDLADSKAVENAAGTFRFVNPCHGRAIPDIPRVPLMIARAGKDEMPGLNLSIDNFVREAIAADLPVTVQNCAGAPHAFDLLHDAPVTRLTISMVLRFLRANLVEAD